MKRNKLLPSSCCDNTGDQFGQTVSYTSCLFFEIAETDAVAADELMAGRLSAFAGFIARNGAGFSGGGGELMIFR